MSFDQPIVAGSTFDKIVDLFKTSVVTQALIVAIFATGTFVLLLTDRPVPDTIYTIDALVVGFYFGGRIMRQQLEIAGQVKTNGPS